MMANVVVVVKTSMSAAASTPVYFAMMGAAARSVTYGVLAEIEALGLDLLEVRRLTPDPQITRIR